MRVAVDLDAAAANWRFFDRLSPNAETAAVVKADAYGLGAHALAPAFARAGARTFFVAAAAEAAALRAILGPGPAIYLLGGFHAADAALLSSCEVRPVLNSAAEAASWLTAGRPGGGCAVHLDTGMNRLGASASDDPALAAMALSPALVMSHLACGGDPASNMNAAQRAAFIERAGAFPGAARSLAASGGALLGPDFAFDLIRPGNGLYGGSPLDHGAPPLAPVVRITAPVLQVRAIAAGEAVGYGATFKAPQAMQIATLGAGYADGLLRSLSGRGYAVLGGERRPFVGRVSMDLITVDATGLDVRAGDEAVLVGPGLSIDDVAAAAGTLAYELLTSLRGAAKTYTGGQ